jgi:hypothetical protein
MDNSVIINQRQSNKYYRCFDLTVGVNSLIDLDIEASLGALANTVSITNESGTSMTVILNTSTNDRIPLEAFSELSWRRDELAISWIRVINNDTSTSGRVIILATG